MPQIITSHDEESGGAATGIGLHDMGTPNVTSEKNVCSGGGTNEDPYIVDWDAADSENPFNWTKSRKWLITLQLAVSTWVAAFCSSSYTGGLTDTMGEFHISEEVALLGVSLYVLGFALGPFLWAPLSEMYGRRIVFIGTFTVFTLLHLGGSLGRNTTTLLVTRTLAGIFGVSPFTNSGGALADIWVPRERGIASSLYASAPFMGPVLGPIVGGWVSQSRLGWHFVFWIMFIISALSLLGFIATPETYGPVLLRWRARRLRRASASKLIYISKFDVGRSKSRWDIIKRNMERPFLFLISEPIVLLLAIYMSIAYATLYAFFAAYPIVFEEQRHFSHGVGGLVFIGVGVGTTFGLCLAPIQNRLYWRAMDHSTTGRAPPEARLYSPMAGAFCLPIGLFWFAWTSEPPVPWIVPILAGAPSGMGVALIMQGLTQYFMDAYGIYGASALAAAVVLRSISAAIFPEVVPIMYRNLGDAWACSIFAFLALACMPLPFLFFKYGPWIRSRSRWALKDALPSSVGAKPSGHITMQRDDSLLASVANVQVGTIYEKA